MKFSIGKKLPKFISNSYLSLLGEINQIIQRHIETQEIEQGHIFQQQIMRFRDQSQNAIKEALRGIFFQALKLNPNLKIKNNQDITDLIKEIQSNPEGWTGAQNISIIFLKTEPKRFLREVSNIFFLQTINPLKSKNHPLRKTKLSEQQKYKKCLKNKIFRLRGKKLSVQQKYERFLKNKDLRSREKKLSVQKGYNKFLSKITRLSALFIQEINQQAYKEILDLVHDLLESKEEKLDLSEKEALLMALLGTFDTNLVNREFLVKEIIRSSTS